MMKQKNFPKKKEKKKEPVDEGRMISAKGEREKPNKTQNTALASKIMMFVLPLIMVLISWGYNAAFAIYIVAMSTCGAIINFILSYIFSKKSDELAKPKNKNNTQIKKPDYVRQQG